MDYEELSGDRVGESSESVRARVQAAGNIQQARFTNPEYRLSNNGSSTDIVCNAEIRVGEIRQFCRLQDEVSAPDADGDIVLCMTQPNVTAREASHSRTIADLAGCEEIQSVHLAEAPQCRPKIIM